MAIALCVLTIGVFAGATHDPDGDPDDLVEASYPLEGRPGLGVATPNRAGATSTPSTTSTTSTTPTPAPTTTQPPIETPSPVTSAVTTIPAVVPPPTTTPPVPPSTCGPEITKADGTPWTCTFADEFHGTTLDRSKWMVHESGVNGFPIGKECRIDSPSNIQVDGGTLELFVRKEPAPIDCAEGEDAFQTRYTGSTVSTSGLFSQTYGRFEIRARVVGATAPGLHSAIWMWPQNFASLGDYGEIDIAEMYSLYPDRAIPYLHYNGTLIDPSDTNNYCVLGDVADWHDYVLEWTPRQIEIIYDGERCLRNRWNLLTGLVQSFDRDFYLILTQALGVGGNGFEAGTTPLPASMEVDHVRIWE